MTFDEAFSDLPSLRVTDDNGTLEHDEVADFAAS
jgi:hypothetical protein